MRDIFLDLSIRSVRLNFLRSILASIGIVIGVVAISSMGMLGANMQLSVKQQLSSDVNTIMITSDVVRTTSTAGTPVTAQGIDKSTLTDIKNSAGQNQIIPIHRTSTQFTIGSTDGRGSIYGLDPNDIPKFLTIEQQLQYECGEQDQDRAGQCFCDPAYRPRFRHPRGPGICL
jgi:putative ABC transport system permease protein